MVGRSKGTHSLTYYENVKDNVPIGKKGAIAIGAASSYTVRDTVMEIVGLGDRKREQTCE